MDYEGFFKQRLDALRAEGRYRVFADLERRCGRFPRAFDHRIGAEVTVPVQPAADLGPGQYRRIPVRARSSARPAADGARGRDARPPGLCQSAARARRRLSTFATDTPQVYLDIDRDKAQVLGVKITDIFNALQSTLDGFYVNSNLFGRAWQVNVQA
jgi:multidrug efflux pump subunit AcrB